MAISSLARFITISLISLHVPNLRRDRLLSDTKRVKLLLDFNLSGFGVFGIHQSDTGRAIFVEPFLRRRDEARSIVIVDTN